MKRGWEVEYVSGKRIKEVEMGWNKIPKVGIVKLTLHYDGKRWDIQR